ncbi:MAG: hypothetical protein ACRD50_13140 [Candidatus Acidiferrales bacterium]
MQSGHPSNCRIAGCNKHAVSALGSQQLCLPHFVDITFAEAGRTLECCTGGQPVDRERLAWLLAEAPAIVKVLVEDPAAADDALQDRILELLLCLANLHEYVKHHAVPPGSASGDS